MTHWYLVLYILGQGSSVTTIPTPYDTKAECETIAKDWDSGFYGQKHMCIKTPDALNNEGGSCYSYVYDKDTNLTKTIAVPCTSTGRDKGYVCQPGASVCEMVK